MSAAMIADAFHSFSDFGTDIVALLSFRIVDKPVDKNHNYGHGKVETLAAVIIGVVLFGTGARVCWSGFSRVFDFYQGQSISRPGLVAFYVAIISVISKEWLYRYTIKIGKAIKSQAVTANAWHHRSDAFSSFAAIIGIGGAIVLGEKWRVLDPVAAIVVSFLIIRTAVAISSAGINELMEVSLDDETENEIMKIIRAVPGAQDPHNLRTRKIGNYISVEVHINVNKDLNITEGHAISTKVEKEIKKKFEGHAFVSVHVEPASP